MTSPVAGPVRVSASLLDVVLVRGDDGEHAYVLTGLVSPACSTTRSRPDLLATPPPRRTAMTADAERAVIATQRLTKRFGRLTAVDGLDLMVRPGRPLRLPRTERFGQDDDGAHAARVSCSPRAARSRCSAARCPGRPARCSPRSERSSRGQPPTRTCRPEPTCGCWTPPAPGRRPSGRVRLRPDRRRPAPRSRTRSSRSAWPTSAGDRCGPTRSGCASDSGWPPALVRGAAPARPRRADQRPGPARHPRGARAACWPSTPSDDGVPVEPPAGRGRAAVRPGRGAAPRPPRRAGRISTSCAGRPGAPWCGWTTASRRAACSVHRSSTGRTAALVLEGTTVAEATARLVRHGVGVLEAAPERRTLEQTVLELTS